ncbi:MAG TPA: triphosphoribosyl-dephospho-CoA synthase [Caulifigura sp.]|nr:triphosphoribosyl-dephospho-CoA synthase [Caulifigura sp.]
MTRPLADLIRLACQAEVLARKPGNVHPDASFDDLTAADFLVAAEVVAPVLSRSAELGIGRAVDEAIRATRERIATNANLGICLLMAPIAAAIARGGDLRSRLAEVLNGLSIDDATWAYRAIRRAAPGGLGESSEQDVADEPTVTLMEAMSLAAGRDGVARQYATGFSDVFEIGVPSIAEFMGHGPETAIVAAHLHLMAVRPDTLIERKCGPDTARHSAELAADVLRHGWPAGGADKLEALDRWLRADGHRRNPGTTADLVAATILTALLQSVLNVETTQRWCNQVAGGKH